MQIEIRFFLVLTWLGKMKQGQWLSLPSEVPKIWEKYEAFWMKRILLMKVPKYGGGAYAPPAPSVPPALTFNSSIPHQWILTFLSWSHTRVNVSTVHENKKPMNFGKIIVRNSILYLKDYRLLFYYKYWNKLTYLYGNCVTYVVAHKMIAFFLRLPPPMI